MQIIMGSVQSVQIPISFENQISFSESAKCDMIKKYQQERNQMPWEKRQNSSAGL